MVIQSTADSGQISVQLLTGFTALLLVAISLLLRKVKNAGTGDEAQD